MAASCLRAQCGGERKRARFVGLQVQRDHLVRLGNQQVAGEGHALPLILGVRHALHEIEIATIAASRHGGERCLRAIVEYHHQIAQRLVRAKLVDIPPALDAVGVAEAFGQDTAGSGNLTSEEFFTHFRQALVGVVLVAVVGTARPQRRLVKNDALSSHSAEIHDSQASIAQRARFVKRLCRAGEPHAHGFGRRRHFGALAEIRGGRVGSHYGERHFPVAHESIPFQLDRKSGR